MKKRWRILPITTIVVLVLALGVLRMQTFAIVTGTLDTCDSTSGWASHNTLSADTSNKQEGSASLSAVGSGTDWFVKSYASPLNTGVTESNGYLDLWLYVSNVSQFSAGGQLEITSSGGPDVNEYSWGMSGLNLSNGWNNLHLKLSDASKIGSPNLNAINYFRIYQFLSGSITAKVDYIRFSTEDTGTWVDLTYDDFESGWGNYSDGGGDAYRYTGGTHAHQGNAALGIQDNSGVASSFFHTNGMDVHSPGYTQLKVEFWFKAVSMDNSNEDFWVQYYDGSAWHTIATYARTTDFENNVFYNKVVTLDEATYTFPTNMKIRFMCDASGNQDDVYIDEVRVSALGGSGVTPTPTHTPTPPPTATPTPVPTNTPSPTPTPGGTLIVLDNADSTSGWSSPHASLSLDTSIKQEGTASLSATGNGPEFFKKAFSPAVDSGVTPADGYFKFWLYVSDVSRLGSDNQVEIGSGGSSDVNEYNWNISPTTLSNGWNEIALKLSSAGVTGGLPNLSAINWFRLYNFTSGSVTLKIDHLRFEEVPPTPTPTPIPTGTPQVTANPRIINPTYATDDIVVAEYDVVSDYSADNTGSSDASSAIQQAINDCYASGGGTVWMPAGTYRVNTTIRILPFCTLRGDWQNPDVGTAYGTIIQAEVPSGDTPLFLIGGSAGAMGLTVYYPSQNASSPTPYGWTFEIRGNGDALGTVNANYNYHASSVINVTLINAYKGVGVNAAPYQNDVHELSRVENVKGTVLYRGLDARNCADVGMWRYITFNNSYWANAPAAYNPPSRSTLDAWTRANGEAFVLADVEWDSFYALSASDYNIGIHFVDGARISFAGQFAWANIQNTNVAVKADANSIDDRTSAWGVAFFRSVLQGSTNAVQNNATGYIHITDSMLTGGIGGTYSGRVDVQTPGDSPTSYTEIGTVPKPTRAVLYDVGKSPYNAPSTLGSLPTSDATSAIQSALTDAGNAGGGVVYLPAGWYRINTSLTVPANVELRGASSVMNRSQGGLSNGTVLFAYGGQGTSTPETDTALVTLNGNTSGVRGLRVFYPNNPFATADSYQVYPYAIRINGVDDAYVVNVAIENGYKGVVANAGSDRHFIKNVVGATTHGFIRVWASTEGWIEDCHSNLNFWPRNGYGISPWMSEGGDVFWGSFLTTRKNNDRLIHIDNASNEHLMNNFSYGGHHGVHGYAATIEVFNIGTDNVGGYTVVSEGGADIKVMNSMRYNGTGNTQGVTYSYNPLHL